MTDFSPSAIGSVLQGVGSLASAFALFGAAWIGSSTFRTWRRQKLSERHMEQAEIILRATYKARRALANIRSPIIWAHELVAAEENLKDLEDWRTVPADRQKKLSRAQAAYNRLDAATNERTALDECLPMARALFGEDIERAIETLNHQFHLVSVAADASTWEGNDREHEVEIRSQLSSSKGSKFPNKMDDTIDEQVRLIEERCLPVLRLETQ